MDRPCLVALAFGSFAFGCSACTKLADSKIAKPMVTLTDMLRIVDVSSHHL
jgi:hypothetical protein